MGVWAWSGVGVSPDDWRRHLDDIRMLPTWPHPERRPSILIHMVDNGFVPNARQRRELAELTGDPRYRPNIAVVTRNPLTRGVIQAVEWLRPTHGYTVRTFKSPPRAIAWLESERGGPSGLRAMLQQVHMALGFQQSLPTSEKRSTTAEF